MYFIQEEEMKARSIAPGVEIKVMWGQNAMMSLVEMAEGSSIPFHCHPHEQMGMVLEGEFEFVIGSETKVVQKGDKYIIPSNVRHGVTAVKKPSIAMDIFSPPREDYQ